MTEYKKARAAWQKVEEAFKVQEAAKMTQSERQSLAALAPEKRASQTLHQEYLKVLRQVFDILNKASSEIVFHPQLRLQLLQRSVALYYELPSVLASQLGLPEEQLREILQAYEEDRQDSMKIEAREAELTTMSYVQYLQTPEWGEKRQAVLQRAHRKCELCGSSGALNVHHKTYEHRGRELLEDLIVLCRTCHAKFHEKLANPEEDI